jgi:hypothetical protein
MRTQQIAGWAVLGLASALMAGCRVETDKHGDSDNVKIATPFGGLQVKTNDAAVLEDIGLPAYPGSQAVKKDKDHDAADVNMNFGSFHLRVKAASFHTDDSMDKVEAFYRENLKRYGDVIACRNNGPVGTPTRTLEGLTCESDDEGHISVDEHPDRKNELELKTGSRKHQRIVSLEPDGRGTKFGLVVLDLPGKVSED